MIIKGLLGKIVGIVIYVFAFIALVSILLLSLNSVLKLVTDEQTLKIMAIISKYAGIILIILVCTRSALKLPLILCIPYLLLVAAFIVLQFFQPVYDSVIQTITGVNPSTAGSEAAQGNAYIGL